jgi:Ig-like domain-containing protein
MKIKTSNSVVSTKIFIITALLLLNLGGALAQTNVIFPLTGTIWKYNQTNDLYTETPGGVGWTLYDYDDTGPSWQQGPSLFAFEADAWDDALTQTVVNSPRTPNPLYGGVVHHARYFRKKFTYSGPVPAHSRLRLNRRFDDGVIIWLNGVEIGRVNWSSFNPPTFTQRSECFSCGTGPCTGGGDANCEEFTFLPADQLLEGNNIIACSLHQTGDNSSDLVFGTSLEVILPRSPTILSNSEPADRIVLESRTTTLQVYADAFPDPTYQWFYSASASGPFGEIAGATASSYTITNMQAANEGYYYCTVSNVLDSVNSRTAFVRFTDDPDPPVLLNVIGGGKFDRVTLQFSEALDPTAGIEDNFNFSVLDEMGNGVPLREPIAGTLNPDGTVLTLALFNGVFLQENALYTVSILEGQLQDVNGNPFGGTNLSFRSFVRGCDTFLFEAYDTAGSNGTPIMLLYTHPSYPNNPRDVANLPTFDSRHAYGDNGHNEYGARVRGLFVPPITTAWRFFHRSDDAGELFINPNGPDAGGKIRVAVETGCCGLFMPPGDPRTSGPFNLTAGQPYYIEAAYKEGGGDDWLKVAARPASEPIPPGGFGLANADLSIEPFAIQGSAGPAGILSHVTIASQPASQAVRVGQRAAFTVRLSPDVPGCFQWKRDGNDIPGAVSQFYWLPTTTLGDDQAKFSVAISLMGGTTLQSADAILTVTNDTIAPEVTSVTRDLAAAFVVTFNEPVDSNTATNPANYAIDGVPPASVRASGGSAVVLTPAVALPQCPQNHTVSAQNVKDLFNNSLSPTNFVMRLDLLILAINAGQSWRYEDKANTSLPATWIDRLFDDSTWSNGAPVLGFESPYVGDYVLRTPISFVTSNTTAYFRGHFNLASDPSSVTNLQLYQVLDDGAVYYLNGVEIYRSRMNPGPVTPTTLANAGGPEPSGGNHPTEGPFDVSATAVPALRFGDNVLAAELHPSSLTSSDSVFGPALVAQVSACTAERPRLGISRSGNQVMISVISGPGGTIYKSSSLDGPWNVVGPAPQTVDIDPQQAQQFFEIRP